MKLLKISNEFIDATTSREIKVHRLEAKPESTTRRTKASPTWRLSTKTHLLRIVQFLAAVVCFLPLVACHWSWNWKRRSRREMHRCQMINENRHRRQMTGSLGILALDLARFSDLVDVAGLSIVDLVAFHCFCRKVEWLFPLKLRLCRRGRVDGLGGFRAKYLKFDFDNNLKFNLKFKKLT